MDLTTLLENTAQKIRAEAARDRQRGLRQAADLGDHHADLVERGLEEWWRETLTLREAAEEVGQSYDAIQRKVARGDLPNAGRKNNPRVRRMDLFGGEPLPLPRD